jgi:hypothetical protein
MTDDQLQALHDDIRDGVSMIVEKSHYYEMEAENKRLKEAIEDLYDANEANKALIKGKFTDWPIKDRA